MRFQRSPRDIFSQKKISVVVQINKQWNKMRRKN